MSLARIFVPFMGRRPGLIQIRHPIEKFYIGRNERPGRKKHYSSYIDFDARQHRPSVKGLLNPEQEVHLQEFTPRFSRGNKDFIFRRSKKDAIRPWSHKKLETVFLPEWSGNRVGTRRN